MERVYNFSAGPAMLPEEVLREAQEEILNYRDSGMSVMEMSHRSSIYQSIIEEAEKDLRELADIPDQYEVLFLQGGASLQFSMVPMNLMSHRRADYILTGMWAKKAAKEAERYGDIRILASGEDSGFSVIPDVSKLAVRPDSDYVYICENNTIYGTRFSSLPDVKGRPLVADQSSCFLSEPLDISRYGIIFAGAQKNIGPAGVTVVVIRKDLISDDVLPGTATMLTYKTHADEQSLFNTPPAYAIYICGKVFRWLRSLGGLEAVREINSRKASLLYDYLDQSELFHPTVPGKDRSLMNVPFVTGDPLSEKRFISYAEKEGLVQLKGHRSVGGMRASLYNAMPLKGVEKLLSCMHRFEKEEQL